MTQTTHPHALALSDGHGGADEVRRETDDRPIDPTDYALLNAIYGTMLVGVVVVATRERGPREPISGPELVPLAAATFALSKVVAREKIGAWVRDPFVEVHQEEGRRPAGEGLRHALGELLTCSRCLGAWSALGLVGLRTASPTAGRTVTNILAASAGNDFLQAGFRLLAETVNATEQRARKDASDTA